MAELFTEDGRIELPFATFPRDVLPEPEHADVLSRYAALQHSYSNLAIRIEGDAARTRLYFTAVHVLDEPGDHGDVDFTWTDGRGFPGAAQS